MRRYKLTLTTCVDRNNLKFFIKDANPSARHSDIVTSVAELIK